MKTHLSFATADLNKSILFYSTLLDASPLKTLSEYALFVVDDPGLELALDVRERVFATNDAHYGLCVETLDEVERAIERLRMRGLAGAVERESTCCYANQTKVWATDPDGRRWEVYTVHTDTSARDDSDAVGCCAESEEACCSA